MEERYVYMKKAVLIFTVILSVSLFAGCGSQKEPAADPAGTEVSGEVQTDNLAADASAEEKQTADASAEDAQAGSSEEVQSGEEEEEKTMTGTLDEIKDFMFVLKEGEDTYYAFAFDEKPEGLDSLKTGDKVTVTYTGEVSEIDPFTGKIISVEKAE